MIRFHCFMAPRGCEPLGDPMYVSRFGFIWWFWMPRLHIQQPDMYNPRVVRLIWMCFAAGVEIWGAESKAFWPKKIHTEAKEAKP